MATVGSSTSRDRLVTLAATGVLAYLLQTLGHEALGHGGACMLLGGHVSVIAPLWMRCSIESKLMVASGPGFNVVAAAVAAALLARRTRLTPFSYFLWLYCAFNALVACGYLMVGGATTFGDWGVLFTSVEPGWMWRTAALVIGFGGYLASLRFLAKRYGQLTGRSEFAARQLSRRTLIPGAAAAVVACLAEFAAGVRQPFGFVLPLACTLLLGWTLMSLPQAAVASDEPEQTNVLPMSWPLVFAALLMAVFFVVVIGGAAARAVQA